MFRQFRVAWLSLAVASVLVCVPIRTAGAAEKWIAGKVVDGRGAGLQDVTLFLTMVERLPSFAYATTGEKTPGRTDDGAMTLVRSGEEGDFSILLPAGRYRIAALKRGYDVSVAEVNTLARAYVEVRMRPGPRAVLGDLPAGPASGNLGLGWILRQQPSDILRERVASLPESAGARPEAGDSSEEGPRSASLSPSHSGWMAAVFGSIDGEFEQQFTGAESTTLALRGAIRGEGSWRFDGLLGRSSADLVGEPGYQARRSDRVALGLDYHLGPNDDLNAEIEYSTSRYMVDPNGETVDATDQSQRTAGLRSQWTRSLGDDATLNVAGSFFATGVRIPDRLDSPLALQAGGESASSDAIDRAWMTTAGLEFTEGRHQLDFGIRTKGYRYDLRDQGVLLYGLEDAPSLTEPGERGNSVSLFGRDSWSLGRLYEMDYGLRYHGNLSATSAYFVPAVGVTRRSGGDGALVWKSTVLYRIDAASADRLAAAPSEAARLGYLLGVEHRPAGRLQMSATLSYRPFQEGFGENDEIPAAGAWSDGMLLLTDATAGRREMEVQLARRLGAVEGSIGGSVGTVRGRVTPTIEEAPVQILTVGGARYYRTSMQARYLPTATELKIEFRRVQTDAGDEDGVSSPPLDYRRLDMVVYQDLPWISRSAGARFKVLMAYQGLFYGSLYDVAGGSGASGTASRLSGGVDVSF
jgi:hypothetical protein